MPIPFYSLDAQHAAVADALREAHEAFMARQWFVLGEGVQRFEAAWARCCGTAHAVGVGNGQDALMLSLRALGVGPGDEVIVPAHTFVATAMAVSQAGAAPIMADVDAETGLLTAATVSPRLTPRTRAVIPVHLYGHPAPLAELLALTSAHGMHLLEDNAQAHGARYRGRPTGGFGAANATSFYPTKNLGALGDAGAVTTNDAGVAERLRRLGNYGSSRKYHHKEVGVNSRLDEWQAIVLDIKLRHLAEWTAERRRLASLYDEHLRDVPHLQHPPRPREPDTAHVWHLYVVRHPRRDALQAALRTAEIGTLIHYPTPVHLQPAYEGLRHRRGDLPNAERWSDEALSLPLYPGLSEQDVARVAEVVRRFGRT
ncbi:MAG: DegT/DnrJ/EryC1/StrS family aminotransferase [Catalinimonas sp.]